MTDDNLVNQLREVEQYPDPMLRSRIIGAANRIEQLTSGPGGIMEMKQTIANLEEKLEKIASHHIPGVIPDGYTMTEWILKNYTMLKDIARG